ncbi:macro domain-containing protein [Halostagnicola kamekurae]|uniref:O-acetyl-ADP-ribose deacetylase (Regulator of RNase III), contains Macro domain n=1 Tax=Halostagnicola kamekurae TaxID=619731 RepID=A0A1I6QVL8_9EURY|nr:macro domain-containing protein [Halostagnicola kamekurae]SFS56479.1 O-acetyl-ADP-ribose deacetylase (regulator of RNase III), contains Macro domain [Halostagnicola kamekurae]
MEFDVVQGDIASRSADALVNAAGTSLEMGSGVAGALRRGGGEELNQEAKANGPVDLGDAAVTDAYDLDAEYVIHAAAMPHYGDGRATAESVRNATRNSLEAADDLTCESLVIPALGCGVAGFDLADGARIIGDELASYRPDALEDVRFIVYSDEEYDTIRSALEENTDEDVPGTESHAESEADR